MKEIEFFSFKHAPKELKQEWLDAAQEVIQQGQFIGGSMVKQFEIEFSKYLNVKYTVGVGNGYDAIFIALKVLGVGPGHRVAVPSHTFIATWLAVGATGATPVGIDCDQNGLMDLNDLEAKNGHFYAVIPVHMHGQMVDMPKLNAWAKKYNTKIIEDCAQAHGAQIEGKKAGTWGDFGAFSFYPTKNLGALGDAGALTTDNEDLAAKTRSYANYGSVPSNKYSYQYLGINSRLDPIQAAILKVNLKYLDSWNKQRQKIAEIYKQELGLLDHHFLSKTQDSIFHHFVVLSGDRDLTRKLLLEKGIITEIHYPECAGRSYQKLNSAKYEKNTTNAANLARKTLSLPLSAWMPENDIEYVLEIFIKKEIKKSMQF